MSTETPTLALQQRTPPPAAPATLEDTGLPADRVHQLLVKTLYGGEATGIVVADRLRLPFTMIEPLLEHARSERLVEVRGATVSSAAHYRYALTDLGMERARQFLDINQYVGPAPVPLAAYTAHMRALAGSRAYIDRERLRAGFSHLVVDDRQLEQIGPAVNASRAVFLYGPPGNGKTRLAEGMGRSAAGDMFIPHAIDVDGHPIVMFDPTNHDSLEAQDEPETSVINRATRDRRWVRIRPPVITVGGELTLDMLELTFSPLAKYYEAPVQLKANGGVLLVDDFGRQRIRPQDLLNRWIVPLESRVDYLTLHTGKKFQIPFEMLVVLATNLDPASLADEAFLRRIPYKIAVTDPSLEQFISIFEQECRRRSLPFHQVLVAYLHGRHYQPSGRPLRACHPRDLLDQVVALCRYRGIEPAITRELLDAACASYFIDSGAAGGGVTPSRSGQEPPRLEVH
jgi:hypothetical protein